MITFHIASRSGLARPTKLGFHFYLVKQYRIRQFEDKMMILRKLVVVSVNQHQHRQSDKVSSGNGLCPTSLQFF
jgi:hypothetical protein